MTRATGTARSRTVVGGVGVVVVAALTALTVLTVLTVLIVLAGPGAAPAGAEPWPGGDRSRRPVGEVGSRTTAPVPRLAWSDCGAGYQCATAAVPLDWARPRGRTISLALVRLPATGPGTRLGTVFVNPGGPGASGVDAVRNAPNLLPPPVRARFDVVGFDPRFVGASRPAGSCLNDVDFLDLLERQPDYPTLPQEEADVVAARADYSARCAGRTELAHASTGSVARDLDLLRQAVGDPSLTYVGYSYGTYLGQVYAQLFRDRVRAMVLDGVVDGQAWRSGTPDQWRDTPYSLRVGSAAASEDALDQFFLLCTRAGTARCPLAAQGDPRASFDRVSAELAAAPILLPRGDQLDQASLISITTAVLYAPGYWPAFAADLQDLYLELTGVTAAERSAAAGAPSPSYRADGAGGGIPAGLAGSAEAVLDRGESLGVGVGAGRRPGPPGYESGLGRAEPVAPRTPARTPAASPVPASTPAASPAPAATPAAGPASGVVAAPLPVETPADNGFATFAAVGCADTLNPASASAWPAAADRAAAQHPHFGRAWTWVGVQCASWPFQDRLAYRAGFGTRTAPLLVVGVRHDPATPYAGAATVAGRYPGSRLLTVEGYGHTSTAMPSACAGAAIGDYLVTRRLPATGRVCPQDDVPFGP